MLPENENIVEFLKQVLIFNEFTEDELAQVANRLNSEYVQAGKVIFSQGAEPDHVYIVVSGEVFATRLENDETVTFLANFDSGDTFGEDALVSKRLRSATITAKADSELYYLTETDFNWIRKTFPQIDPYLIAFNRTHDTIQKLKIDWLNEGETISLVARRHPISMIIELLVTAFLVSLTLTLTTLFITFLKNVRAVTLLSAGVAGIITLIGLVAGIWSFFEWRNDYFFITNLRVVWRERILFRSASRQEVPLRTIQSLNAQTPNVFARLIQVGDLVIRTFNSEMRLTDVYYPEQMKAMINAFLLKARGRSIRAEHASIRRTIRTRLGIQEETHSEESDAETLSVQSENKRLTLFKTRIVEVPVFKVVGLMGLLALYFLPFAIFLWWLYQYEDWRNDIYRVTKDRIVDRDKKPFGQESFRSAPIKNIQSVGHEIPNTIGLIINVGNVKINVGDETFTFDGVYDPALVHQDISRRMEELVVRTERDRINQEHERMATWLEIYNEETKGEFDTGPVEHIPDFD
jgi:hypothetical protein